MLSEEDFEKLNSNIHTRLAAASWVTQKIDEVEEERDDECGVVIRDRDNKTPFREAVEVAPEVEEKEKSGWSTP